MRNQTFLITALSALALAICQPAAAIAPRAADYYTQPPLMVGSQKPAILMILSKDMDIYAPAYVYPGDHDGDGRTDVGFNPGVVYTGIFDPYSCYTYNVEPDGSNNSSSADKRKDWSQYPNWIDRPHFVRLGPSIEDVEDAAGQYKDANRLPKEIRDGYDDSSNGRPGFPAPRSATGICPAKDKVDGTQNMDSHGKNVTNANQAKWSTYGETRMWSGNWLNWLTSSRIDVIRQVLYGGKRVVDLPGTTYIAAEWVPNNAGVWSYDDFTRYFWLDYNEGADFYESNKYTPIDADRFGGHYRRLHSLGRSDNRFFIYDNIWFMRQKEDVTSHEGFRSYNAFLVPKFRNQYTPLIYVLNSFADREKTEFWEVTVDACRLLTKEEVYDYTGRLDYKAGRSGVTRPKNKDAIPSEALIEAGDYCERYGQYYKPAGLLQRYAKQDQALFGLFTGAFSNQNRWDGGWLRHNVSSIKGQVNSDGTYKGTARDNIFLMLDSIGQVAKPRLDPLNEARTAVDAASKSYGSGWQDPLESNFGNPVGEMLYAGLLYFAHHSGSAYSMYPSETLMGPEQISLPRLGASGQDPWKSPLFANSGDCLKPVMLLLSSTTTSHDGDMLPGSPHALRSGAGGIPVLSLPFVEPDRNNNFASAGIPRGFSMGGYLDAITRHEGLAGKQFYIANINKGFSGAVTIGDSSRQPAEFEDTNLCVPRTLTSLADVRGLCPSSPQTYGTYSAAAVAYYGNTHDFDGTGNKVQTFAVALPSIFPKINLESRGRIISISPVAMSVAYPCGDDSGKPPFCKDGGKAPQGIQFVGPFATNVIQWRADDAGRVYSGAVFAGFTGRLEGEGDDYQLDAPVRYYFDLIRECQPGECDKGNVESFRYKNYSGHSGYPSYDDERDIAYVFFHQPYDYGHPITDKNKPGEKKYKAYNPDVYDKEINDRESSEGRCNNSSRRELVAGCGSAKEKEVAVAILKGWFDDGNRDGRYAAAPFKRHREWVYKNWDHAGRPNYIFSGERPKNYHIAAYMPKRWSQMPGYFHRPTGILTAETDPDPTLMQTYARLIYPELSKNMYSSSGEKAREEVMRRMPGAEGFVDYTSNNIITKPYYDSALGRDRSAIDYVLDETSSVFIDRPFTDLGYEEVMDVYGYIGEPYKVYKKVTKPEEIDKAVGVAIFVYSLNEKIDLSDRSMPMNIGYYMHGGLNYPQSKEDNPSRRLGSAEGTYLEIQNEHNYMGGSPQKVLNEGLIVKTNADGREFGLMTIAHPLNTPPTCYRAGTMDFDPRNFMEAEREQILFKNHVTGDAQMPGFISDTHKVAHKLVKPGCGSARLPLTSTRLFKFPEEKTLDPPTYLPDPLWLAAKYGGFNDENYDGIPQKTEFDVLPSPNGDGIPDNYFYANTLSELKEKLSEAFERIMSTMNVGTATSASVNSVLGGGVTVRTYFQTVHSPTVAPDYPEIKWLGGTYALFIDLWGNMREDTNGNGQLDLDSGFEGEPGAERGEGSRAKGDWIVEFVDCDRLSETSEILACAAVRDASDIKTMVRVYPDETGNNVKNANRVKYLSLENVRTVWNLSRNLSALASRDDVVTKRARYLDLSSPRRRVYFYHDALMAGSNLQFSDNNIFSSLWASKLAPYMLQANEAKASALIDYVLGWDQAGFRSRQTLSSWHDLTPGSAITCRLGDVINSQPIISGSPFSNYDYLYGDSSYAAYRNQYSRRRHLAIVGANDGMLHAVNMGFQKSLLSGLNGYEDSDPKFIGREMWAFIPQSVLPHLQWLGQTDYAHSYYLDLTPTVVEIKDPAKGEAQGGPWRTIVLGSLRFGGRAIEMGNGNYSYSEVFALDVTDPDKEPVLLWRFSHPQLGLVVARPTVVRNNQQGDHWYVLVGSGPTYDAYNPKTLKTETTPDGPLAYKGYSNQSAKIFVFDAVRGPSAGVEILDSNRPKSFFTSMQALTAPGSSVKDEQGSVSWNNNLAYFSLNQSALDNDLLCLTNATQTGAYLDASNPAHLCGRSKYSNYGYLDKGGVWRLNMSGPLSSWKSNLAVFYDADRPVTGAVNTTYDASGRLWVIFGSGRFWTNDDSRLCEGSGDTKECWVNHVNYLYGIKEPVSPQTGELTYGPVAEASLVDVSNVLVYPDGEVGVAAATGGLEAFRYGTEVITSYSQLYSRIMSESSGGYRRALKTNSTNFIDSEEIDSPGDKKYETRDDWWSGLSFEMILEQVAVAPFGGGSIMSLSTFLPRSLSCGSNGHSYGLLLDTFTGLPRPEFGTAPFLEKNQFQFSNAPAGANGARAVSDHVASVGGKSAAAVFVVTGTNEGKHGQFEIVNSDGTVTVFKIPDNDTIKGGVLSWREVLDFSIAGQ